MKPKRVWFFGRFGDNFKGIDFGHFSHNFGLLFLHSSVELDMFSSEEALFSSLSIRPSTKDLYKLCLVPLYQLQWS